MKQYEKMIQDSELSIHKVAEALEQESRHLQTQL